MLTSVALRKESVDRNSSACQKKIGRLLSLSARRAWIEIIDYIIDYVNDAMSLSARRAWIEIGAYSADGSGSQSRSPQGERG